MKFRYLRILKFLVNVLFPTSNFSNFMDVRFSIVQNSRFPSFHLFSFSHFSKNEMSILGYIKSFKASKISQFQHLNVEMLKTSIIKGLQEDVSPDFENYENFDNLKKINFCVPILIFHCEYSLKRGPKMSSFVRGLDRNQDM